jgi:MFS family permease
MRVACLALAAITVTGWPTAAPQPADLTQCRAWQESQAVAARLTAMGPPPTRIRIMSARYFDLVNAEAGLEKTKLLGLGLDNGQWMPTPDDVGLYIIVPWLARGLGLPVGFAYDLFFSLLIAVSFVTGTIGFLTLTAGRWPRLFGVAALTIVSLLAFRIGDVYILLGMIPVALVPWILLAARCSTLFSVPIVGAISGGVAAASNFVRAGSGTILLIFLSLALAFGKSVRPKIKLAAAAATAVCFAIVAGAFMHIVAERDIFLRAHTFNESLLRSRHPFWHPVYAGFGYAKNDLVPAYRDEVAVARVCSERPNADYLSLDYERVLRNATEQLMWDHPVIIVRNLAKKTLVVALIVLLCGNIGWFAFLRRPIVWSIDLAFFAAMAVNSLYGLLVVPYATYLFGLISYSALFGATSVMLAAERTEARS